MSIVFESETGNSSENINEIHQLWAKIYERVGLRLGLSTESLRFAATLKSPKRPYRPLGRRRCRKPTSQPIQGRAKASN